jgi:hypothetical protein
MYMQLKLLPENVEPLLKKGKFKVTQKSENQIEAFKPFDHGRIHLRMKRVKTPYLLEDNYWWAATFHLEIGLRPKRFFDSPKVHEFAEKYIVPYSKSK